MIMWPILDRFPCTLVAITITITCLPEPATSSGHPSLLHLGDESALYTLTCVFSHHCQHFPEVPLPHHQLFWSSSNSRAALEASSAPHVISASVFLCLRLCVQVYLRSYSKSTRLFRVFEPQLPQVHPVFSDSTMRQLVLCRLGLKALSRPSQAQATKAVAKVSQGLGPGLWFLEASGRGFRPSACIQTNFQ